MTISPIAKAVLISFCGFLLSLSAPGYDLWFLAWIGLSPLFIIINTSKAEKGVAFYSFLFGFAYNLWYLHWLFSLHPLNWLGFNSALSIFVSVLALILVAAFNALFFVLFGVLAVYLKKLPIKPYNSGIFYFILVSFLWLIIFNKLSASKFLLGFPWTLIEYSQYKNLFLIQIAEYFGGVSVGFIIVFFNFLLAELLIWLLGIQRISNKFISKMPGQVGTIVFGFSLVTVLVSVSMIYGLFLYEKNRSDFKDGIQTVCVLQGNLPLKVTRGSSIDIDFARKRYQKMITNKTGKLIVFPEGALPTVFHKDKGIQQWLKELSDKMNFNIISGSYCKQNNMLTNCAVSYVPNKKGFSYYEKERLVPFGEFTPFSFLLPGFFKKLASNVIGDGFANGKHNLPVKTSIGNAGINICFELIFPTIIRKHALQGADFLVNISDLSWFSNDLIKKQFLGFAVFRAVENRRWLVIAANNGISAFIEPSGRIKSLSQENTQGILLDLIKTNNKTTFYAKYGW